MQITGCITCWTNGDNYVVEVKYPCKFRNSLMSEEIKKIKLI